MLLILPPVMSSPTETIKTIIIYQCLIIGITMIRLHIFSSYRKRQKIGETKVWQIWRIVLVLPNFILPMAKIKLISIHTCNSGMNSPNSFIGRFAKLCSHQFFVVYVCIARLMFLRQGFGDMVCIIENQ